MPTRHLPARRCLVTAAVALLATQPARAQLAVDRSEITLRPQVAAERVGLVTVTNTSTRAVQGVVRLEDWDRSDAGANRWFPAGSQAGSCSRLLTVFPLTVSLDPGASQAIRLVLPDSAAALSRECWSAVMVETVQPPAERGGVSYVIRSAVKIYVEPANLAVSGEVVDMQVVRAAGADSIEVWLHNDGGHHYIAKGHVEIRRADNTVAATVPLDDYYILPGARQRSRGALPALPAGDYVAIAMVDFGGRDIAAMQLEITVPPSAAVGKR